MMHQLDDKQRGHVHLGASPHESLPTVSSASPVTQEYYWVGVEVVQMRNIREKRVKNGDKHKIEYIYPEKSEEWAVPIYLILQRSITMPPLGESLHFNDFTAQRLLEQIPEGCLLTASQGGAAVAEYIKEQIANGVSLLDLTRGEFTLQHGVDKATAEELMSKLDDDDIMSILETRGKKFRSQAEKYFDNSKNKDN